MGTAGHPWNGATHSRAPASAGYRNALQRSNTNAPLQHVALLGGEIERDQEHLPDRDSIQGPLVYY